MSAADNVVPVDFGKSYNDATRAFARLAGMAEQQREELARDPAAFVSEQSRRNIELQREMRKLAEASRRPLIEVRPRAKMERQAAMPTVTVPRADYDRWKAADAIIRDWIARGLA